MAFEVYAAIDLREGRCVRLYRGDYAQETVFSEDPASTARRWEREGAHWLHVVDLDGARSGHPANGEAVAAIVRAVELPVELGGGLRSMKALEEAFRLGVARVVLGTVAAEEPDFVAAAAARYGETIAVALDAREGHIATQGWRKKTELGAVELLRQMVALGVRRFVYTDIARDGTETEPDFAGLAEVLAAAEEGARVVASGGVASTEHVLRLREMGAAGVIVGRALYSGLVELAELRRRLASLEALGAH